MKSYESDEENVAAMIRGKKTYKESELNWGVERERGIRSVSGPARRRS